MEETNDLRAERLRRETNVRIRADRKGLIATKSRRIKPGGWFVIDPATQTLALGPTDLDDLEKFLAESS